MKNLIIWSFGNADIYFDDKMLDQYNLWEFENKSFVEKVKIITENFDKYKEKVSFNMFESFYSQYKWNKVNDFVWIFTKQQNKYSNYDTYCLYDLFRKYVDYKNIENIVVLPENEQIVLNDAYDEQKIFDILNVQLLRIKDNIENIGYEKVKINITWWTKIMTLLITCSMKFIFEKQDFTMYYGLWNKTKNNTRFVILNDFTKYC